MDESYIYLTVAGKGIYKIGLKHNIKVKPGILYAHNPLTDFKIKAISVVGDRVYIRQCENEDQPLLIFDKQTLKEQKDDEIIKFLKENKRNYDEDDWNKLKFEVTNKDKLKDIISKSIRGAFRCLIKTPLFYDGKNL